MFRPYLKRSLPNTRLPNVGDVCKICEKIADSSQLILSLNLVIHTVVQASSAGGLYYCSSICMANIEIVFLLLVFSPLGSKFMGTRGFS